MSYRLCHLSDLHIGPLPKLKPWQFLGKRFTGWLNWYQGGRHLWHDMIVLDAVIERLKAQQPHHIAVTGDMVNLSLPQEFVNGLALLKLLGASDDVSYVPGNHDAYTYGSREAAFRAFGTYMSTDQEPLATYSAGAFPFLRRRGPLALVGLNSGVPQPPLLAGGVVGHFQLKALKVMLTALREEGLVRVVLIHHPPFEIGWQKRLADFSALQAVLADAGAELVLHGHTHRGTVERVADVPVFGVPSASMALSGRYDAAGFNQFDFDGRKLHFCRHQLTDSGFVITLEQDFSL